MVVLVLIINCHVSEKPSSGPLNTHKINTPIAATNTHGRPSIFDVVLVKRVNISCFLDFFMSLSKTQSLRLVLLENPQRFKVYEQS